MRLFEARAPLCDRAREWISLQLDGELSEFERVLLEGHLANCADCSEFRADAASISSHLRLAPLTRLERPVVLPRRPRVSARALPVVAAAAAAIVVAAGSTLGVATVNRSDHVRSTRPAYLDSAAYDMSIIKRAQATRLQAQFRRAN
jgi:predicted anti-sigma-YlaC factor YlaD